MNKNLVGVVVISAILLGGVIYLLLSKGSSNSQSVVPSSSAQYIQAQVENQKLPDFNLDKYDGSGEVKLSDSYAQKPTIVQFWATWCTICRAEFPINKAIIADKFKDKVNYIAVDWAQGDREAVKDYIKELQLDPSIITFVMDSDGSIGSLFGVRGSPTYLFIKKGGEVSLAQTGGLSPKQFEAEVRKIL